MKFVNAKEGVRKIHTGEMLELLTTILMIVAGSRTSVSDMFQKAGNNDGYDTVMWIASACLIISLFCTAIGSVFKVLGIVKASKDEGSFIAAIIFTLLNLALEIGGNVLNQNELLKDIISPLKGLLNVLTMYCIVRGIIIMSEKSNNISLHGEGRKSMSLILWTELLSIVLQVLGRFISTKSEMFAIPVIVGIVTMILALVSYIVYLKLLKKAANEL